MAEHAQIDIRKGDEVIRIHSRWGAPKEVLPVLQEVAAIGRRNPQAIANEFIRRSHKNTTSGFVFVRVIAEDFQQDALNFHYTVDVSTSPWKMIQEKCAGHKIIDNGDGILSVDRNLTPARKRTLFIKTKAAAADK